MLKLIALKQARTYFSWRISKDMRYLCETHKIKAQKIRNQWYVDVRSVIAYINGKT